MNVFIIKKATSQKVIVPKLQCANSLVCDSTGQNWFKTCKIQSKFFNFFRKILYFQLNILVTYENIYIYKIIKN